jgi:hypothetical protein
MTELNGTKIMIPQDPIKFLNSNLTSAIGNPVSLSKVEANES